MFSKDSFIYKAHCSDGDTPSSKRLWGGVMIACSQLIIATAVILSFIAGTGITEVLKDLIELNIVVGSTLLGVETITRSVTKSGKSISAGGTEGIASTEETKETGKTVE